jgi:hypothetical protein
MSERESGLMRRGNVFWALVLILIGGLLLLSNLGLLRVNAWQLIVPAFLILVGVWFLLRSGRTRSPVPVEHVEIPLQGASRARVRVRHGAGRLHLDGSAAPESIVSGDFGGGLSHHERREGDLLEVRLRVSDEVRFGFAGGWLPGTLDWSVGLNRSIPLELEMEGGASEMTVDLTETKVQRLDLRTGASSTRIMFPAGAGRTEVAIRAGAASVALQVPPGVGARFWIRRGLTGTAVDESRFPRRGDVYQSVDFETAANRVDAVIESGVGSIEVR